MAKVVFHFPKKFHENYRDMVHLKFYGVLQDHLESVGGEIALMQRQNEMRIPGQWADLSRFQDGNLHIIEEGAVHSDNVLNAAIAYLRPYWHLDPKGVHAFGSISDEEYIDEIVPSENAKNLVGRFEEEQIQQRRSRFNQGELPIDGTIPDNCLAVFLQSNFPHKVGSAFCTDEQLLDAVVGSAKGRPVVVKFHPLTRENEKENLILKTVLKGHEIHYSDANVNDILAKCDVTISYNSAVAMEGFVHRKPAVFFGRSDMHHIAETVSQPEYFEEALQRALVKEVGYENYIHWFLQIKSIPLWQNAFFPKVLKIFETAGFDAERLGLKLP